MRNTNKTIAVLLFSILTAGTVMSGCSSSKTVESTSSPSPTQSTTEQSTAPVKEALKPYEVVMVYPDGPQKDLQKVNDAMNTYLKETYPDLNATIKLNPIDWSAWGDKTNLMFASNEKFDLIFTASWFGFEGVYNKGALLPLDDLLLEYGQDIEAVEKEFHDGARRKGKIYGIHTHQELGGLQGIAFSKELVDKYKFDLTTIKKMADLEPMLKVIKENEPGVTPAVGPNFPLDWYFKSGHMDNAMEPIGLYLGEDATVRDNTFVNMYETPLYMDLARMTRSWFKAGYINKDATTQGLDVWAKFKAKKAFAYIGTDMEILKDVNSPQLMEGKSKSLGVDIIQLPLTFDQLRTGKLSATMQSISGTSEDPARAMQVLNLFFKDKNMLTLFNFGVEGTHYVMNNGQIDQPSGITPQTNPFYHDNMWQIGNQMLNYTRVGEDINKYQNYEKFNEFISSRPSNMLGFTFDSEPVKNELIAMDNIRKTYDPGFTTGQLDPDKEVPNMIKKLKAAGLDKVMAETQKQYDEWRKANGK
ncbi:MAG: ABC transporter substrate-binding protein [Gorillibacterium sp.]|nr:ABC transporter substrate-binding protein [Gorillibacterium sp.]